MPEFISMRDAEFWDHIPEHMKHMQEGRNGGNVAYFPLGPMEANPPTVVALHMAPGWVLIRHAHACHRFEVVVQGSLDVGDRILRPGDVMISPPNAAYGPHVAGPEGCTTFEIFTDFAASHTPIMETPEGMTAFDNSNPEGRRRMYEAVTSQAAAAPPS